MTLYVFCVFNTGEPVIKQEKMDIKVEKVDEVKTQLTSSGIKPPPEKKAKLMR